MCKASKRQKEQTDRNRQKPTEISTLENRELLDKTDKANVYKEKTFQKFMLWMSLPDVFKGRGEKYLEQIGVDDEEERELLTIKTKTQFAERYKVRPQTLTDWTKKVKQVGTLNTTKDFFKRLSHNVYGSFYHQTMMHADAQRVRLWEEIFHNKLPDNTPPAFIQNNILTPNFQQVIHQLKDKYKEELRGVYEQNIKQSVSGSKRVRPNKADGRGREEEGRSNPSQHNQE